jgi:hypothetical protein
MTPRFIPGAVYESKTHGLVEFKGIDRYMGQASLRFFSVDHDQTCYWLPSALDLHFGAAQETGTALPYAGNVPGSPSQERFENDDGSTECEHKWVADPLRPFVRDCQYCGMSRVLNRGQQV